PDQLSRWQVIQIDTATQKLVLEPAVHAYALATPRFSDYALKLRTVRLPEGTHARPAASAALEYQSGSVISKAIYYPLVDRSRAGQVASTGDLQFGFDGQSLDLSSVQLIDTRLLVHQADGWQALPYVWNQEQPEATLQIAGDIQRLTLHKDDSEL